MISRDLLPLLLVLAGGSFVPVAEAGRELDLTEATPLLAVNPPSTPDSELVLIDPVAAPAPKRTKSTSVTINLIRRMVDRGLLPKEDAEGLIKDAEEDAEAARGDLELARASAQQAVAAAHAAQVYAQQAAPDPSLPPADESMRITYIPENVRAEMREEIKQDVMEQAKNERWALPHAVPEWSTRIKLFGDIRVRYEGINFPSGNDNAGAFPIFNTINTGAPFDVAGSVFSPQYNVDRTRNRFRLRARVGLEADLSPGFTAGFRIGTGENNSPVTANQTLGGANGGQGGNFSKYALWLDRAYLRYQLGGQPDRDLGITIGRFDNPFFSTSMLWSNDLGFDGAVLQGRYRLTKWATPFLTAGAFPVFNTELNYATNNPSKFHSNDKYLYAIQGGVDLKPGKDFNFKGAVAYYHFQDIEGRLSDPFVPLTPQDQGNTDATRPAFAQNGNTYRPLRNITPTAANNFGTTNQYQYFGLASPFHELAVTGRLDYNRWEPVQVSLVGEYVKNLAFKKGFIDSVAVNNRGADDPNGSLGKYAGGDQAWIAGITVGRAKLDKFGAWNVGANYRYVESDSVVDGFNDSDFGAPLTGTNLKGYTLFGNVALSPRISLGIRYMSADAIAGPTYRSDVIQVDVNGNF